MNFIIIAARVHESRLHFCTSHHVGLQFMLASSPGLFFSLNDNENDERNERTDGRTREKNRLVSIAGVVVCMRQLPLPRFWVIIYVCKLLGFSSIFSVYSCILICVISEAAPWLLNRCMAFCMLTERSLFKLRQEEALMHPYNGVCCMLAALYHLYSTSMLKHTSSSAEQSVVLVILPFVFLIIWLAWSLGYRRLQK